MIAPMSFYPHPITLPFIQHAQSPKEKALALMGILQSHQLAMKKHHKQAGVALLQVIDELDTQEKELAYALIKDKVPELIKPLPIALSIEEKVALQEFLYHPHTQPTDTEAKHLESILSKTLDQFERLTPRMQTDLLKAIRTQYLTVPQSLRIRLEKQSFQNTLKNQEEHLALQTLFSSLPIQEYPTTPVALSSLSFQQKAIDALLEKKPDLHSVPNLFEKALQALIQNKKEALKPLSFMKALVHQLGLKEQITFFTAVLLEPSRYSELTLLKTLLLSFKRFEDLQMPQKDMIIRSVIQSYAFFPLSVRHFFSSTLFLTLLYDAYTAENKPILALLNLLIHKIESHVSNDPLPTPIPIKQTDLSQRRDFVIKYPPVRKKPFEGTTSASEDIGILAKLFEIQALHHHHNSPFLSYHKALIVHHSAYMPHALSYKNGIQVIKPHSPLDAAGYEKLYDLLFHFGVSEITCITPDARLFPDTTYAQSAAKSSSIRVIDSESFEIGISLLAEYLVCHWTAPRPALNYFAVLKDPFLHPWLKTLSVESSKKQALAMVHFPSYQVVFSDQTSLTPFLNKITVFFQTLPLNQGDRVFILGTSPDLSSLVSEFKNDYPHLDIRFQMKTVEDQLGPVFSLAYLQTIKNEKH